MKKVLISQIGSNSIPVIYVDLVEEDTLILYHEHDGKRDLELNHANKVIEHTKKLWKNDVKLITMVDDAPYEI